MPQIAHHHHVIPVPGPQPVPVPAPAPAHVHHPEYSGAPPPYSGPSSYVPEPAGPVYGAPSGPGPSGLGPSAASNPYAEWGGGGVGGGGPSGPGGGYDYAHNRNENVGVLPATHQNNDVMASWGLGASPGAWDDQRVYRQTPAANGHPPGAKRKSAVSSRGGDLGDQQPDCWRWQIVFFGSFTSDNSE